MIVGCNFGKYSGSSGPALQKFFFKSRVRPRQLFPPVFAMNSCSVTSQSQNWTSDNKPIIEENFTHVIKIPTWVKVFSWRLLPRKFHSAEEEREICHVVSRRKKYFFSVQLAF